MGTHKGSKTRKSLTLPARKCKSPSKSKKPTSVAQNTKSEHFPPAPPVVGQVQLMKAWEAWEDQILLDGRKAGIPVKETSQELLGRSMHACYKRSQMLKPRTQSSDSQQKDALAPLAPSKQYWSKKWEDWEDQIVVTHRNAGKSWENISTMMPFRTADSVQHRWKRLLEIQSQNELVPGTQSINTTLPPKPKWNQGEDQLLESLRNSGKSWAEIATQIPTRSKNSCQMRWLNHLRQAPAEKRMPRWDEWEERLLVCGYYAGLSWKEIAEPITGRTWSGCMYHWFRYFYSPDQDEPWTPDELALLASLRSRGSGWDEIRQEIPGHTSSNACRTQWYKEAEGIEGPSSHHRPRSQSGGTKDRWSAEEIEILVALRNTIGPRWEEIRKHIPGRTADGCKTRFRTKCTTENGVEGPPSESWKEFFMSKCPA